MNRRLNLDVHLQGTLKHNGPRRAFAARPDMTIKRAKVTSAWVARSLGVPEHDVTLWRAGSYGSEECGLCAPFGTSRRGHREAMRRSSVSHSMSSQSHRTRPRTWFDLSPLTGTSDGSRAGSLPLTGSTVEMACLKTSCEPEPDSSRTTNWSKAAS
jgi:hypothetical protein